MLYEIVGIGDNVQKSLEVGLVFFLVKFEEKGSPPGACFFLILLLYQQAGR